MALTSTSFKENNPSCHLPRRRHSEKLVYSNLKDYGSEMFSVLVKEARTAPLPSDRIKAADRFLTHTLLQPKGDENIQQTQGVKVFAISIIQKLKALGDKIPLSAVDAIIASLEEMEESSKSELEVEQNTDAE